MQASSRSLLANETVVPNATMEISQLINNLELHHQTNCTGKWKHNRKVTRNSAGLAKIVRVASQ